MTPEEQDALLAEAMRYERLMYKWQAEAAKHRAIGQAYFNQAKVDEAAEHAAKYNMERLRRQAYPSVITSETLEGFLNAERNKT